MTSPYWTDGVVSLWHGRAEDVLPALDLSDVSSVVTDPPYGETSAAWDVWPAGWPQTLADLLPTPAALWCFGSMRMFLEHAAEFTAWRYGQDALWVKPNGSGPTSRDRLVRTHEHAVQWYRGRWGDLHHEWEREQYAGQSKGVVRRQAPAAVHRRSDRETAWHDDGTRQPRSVRVLEAPSVRFAGRHQDEKPLGPVVELVREGTPPAGLVLDLFAGAGTTGIAARILGRRSLLIEADEATCEIAARRLEDVDLLGLANAPTKQRPQREQRRTG